MHFGGGHFAVFLDEVENRQHGPRATPNGDAAIFRQHSGDVIDEAATGDVREALDDTGTAGFVETFQ